MGQMLFIISFLAVFGALAIAADRYIQKRKAAYLAKIAQADENEKKSAMPAVSTQAERAQHFRTWALQAFAQRPEMQRWLNSLSDAGLQGLTLEVASFTKDVGIDLDWLTHQDFSYHPTTQRQLTDMIWHYCQAWHDASAAHKDVKVLQTWHAFECSPTAKSQQPLLQTLAAQLTAQKLMPPVSPEMLVAPEHQRQAHTIQMIRDVAQQEPARFYQVLPEAIAAADLVANQTTFGAFTETIQHAFASRFTKKVSPAAETNGQLEAQAD